MEYEDEEDEEEGDKKEGAPDAVEHGGGELPPEPQVGAELPAELLGGVGGVGEVPLELVHQGDVAQVDVQLDHHALVLLLLQQVVRLAGEALHLQGVRW